ncbi:hypothetical protein EQG63_06445 [Flavobacterium amnicola]|uniref:Uncharacterized protein n=1 Tax=Flavobacterium amnicola TaxID=2506422 RepID=A0A4Q1K3M6_9FLAO|nr:hypothetical protein EQG63_06445 [Flavobacterium amnicola]
MDFFTLKNVIIGNNCVVGDHVFIQSNGFENTKTQSRLIFSNNINKCFTLVVFL